MSEKPLSAENQSFSRQPTDKQLKALTAIFDALDADFGSRWNPNKQQLVDSESGKWTAWGARWVDHMSGMSGDDIRRGLQCLRDECPDWPPGAAEFGKMCLVSPEELGLPSVEYAYKCACNSQWKHEAIWKAATMIGTAKLRSAHERTTRGPFERCYAWVVREIQRGQTFSGPENIAPQLASQHEAPAGYQDDWNAIQQGADPIQLMRDHLAKH